MSTSWRLYAYSAPEAEARLGKVASQGGAGAGAEMVIHLDDPDDEGSYAAPVGVRRVTLLANVTIEADF